MKKNKVQVFTGFGSFIEPKKIKVESADGETQEIEGENILIATGSEVRTLPGLEIDHEKVISSDDIVTNDKDYPKSVIILGSGAVGVEFASMYNDFGTEVTIVEVVDRIVPSEDPELSAELQKSFENRGIRVMTGTMADPKSLEKTDDGVKIKVAAPDQGQQKRKRRRPRAAPTATRPTPPAIPAKAAARLWRQRRSWSPSGAKPSPRTSTST
jgi:dihydrolipoamide dehydrogenase